MTEVWEEKPKTGSEDVEEKGGHRNRAKNTAKKVSHKKTDVKEKKAQEEDNGVLIEEIGAEKSIAELREELRSDMKAIKEERRRLEKERYAFREEMSKDLGGFESTDVVALEEDENEQMPMEDIEEIERELDRIEPEVAEIGRGISKVDLEQLTMELEDLESELSTKVDFAALTRMSEDYERSIKRIDESITATNRKIDGVIQEMKESESRYGAYQNVIKELKRLDEKTNEIFEEIGFGESLNVSKIPPNILETVYESTIDGIVDEIHSNYGSHDAESIITSALDDIRRRTSGSELFYFDGRTLRTRNLARAIQNGLISAKQVQTTYDELLSKLLEYLPGHKARNFRAMIKLKSQEYAVDKTVFLLGGFDIIRKDIGNLMNLIGIVSNRQNSIDKRINDLIESMVCREDIEEISGLMEEIKAKQSDFDELVGEIKERMEEDKKVFFEGREKDVKRSEKNGMEAGVKRKMGRKAEEELSGDELRILTMIPSKGFTSARIKKDLSAEMDEERIEECLQSLMDKGVMSAVKHGRHTIYVKTNEKKGGEK